MGSGFPRAAALLQALAELGYLITLYATNGEPGLGRSTTASAAVEVIPGGPAGSARVPRVAVASSTW